MNAATVFYATETPPCDPSIPYWRAVTTWQYGFQQQSTEGSSGHRSPARSAIDTLIPRKLLASL